jgi:hypothetical protein
MPRRYQPRIRIEADGETFVTTGAMLLRMTMWLNDPEEWEARN